MKLRSVCNKINDIFPTKFALEGDRVGLQLEAELSEINKVLVAYEANEQVIEEAISKKCQLIVVFHPLLFMPLKRIEQRERVSKLMSKILKNDISLYSIHTSFDTYPFGTNHILAEKLGLTMREAIDVIDQERNFSMGLVGEFPIATTLTELLEKCSEIFLSQLKLNPDGPDSIKKVAIIGGSGTSYLDKVEKLGVDAFITADTTYHNYHKINGKFYLIDPGHFEMEMYNAKAIAEILSKEIDLVFEISNEYTNPLRYYPDNNFSKYQSEFINNIRL